MARKDTQNKPKLSLLKYKLLAEMAKVREFGINKYQNDTDWTSNPQSDYVDAALRHLFKYADGEITDNESGLNHLAHAAVNLMLIMELGGKE